LHCTALLLAVAVFAPLKAATVVLDFEAFSDGTSLTNQYPGVTFSNAIILTAGISLNEFEFPPSSGVNVVSDNNGPLSILFASPVLSFSGYFTYAEPLTLAAFDDASNQVTTATSAYSNNMAISGDVGSGPNECLRVAFTNGISSITITGDLAGGSFTLDDATYTPVTTTPEPATLTLFVVASIALLAFQRAHQV
jgi:hypothetical protein